MPGLQLIPFRDYLRKANRQEVQLHSPAPPPTAQIRVKNNNVGRNSRGITFKKPWLVDNAFIIILILPWLFYSQALIFLDPCHHYTSYKSSNTYVCFIMIAINNCRACRFCLKNWHNLVQRWFFNLIM